MVNKDEIISKFKEAIIIGDEEAAVRLAKEAIAAGLDAYEMVTKYGGEAMEVINKQYEEKKIFVPEVLLAANALSAAVEILKPHMKVEKTSIPAKVVLGVVEGDIHDIGKNLVKIMLSSAGFEVIDLGRDVPLQKFIEVAKQEKADVVGMSALMSTTMPGMKKVIDMLKDAGIRNKVKVIVGGAPVTEEWALSIGADARPKDASAAVGITKQLVEKLRKERGDSW
ncbi:MAG: corrinoid protein [Candidatus Methanomethyliaceae archaeon]|nr:corrinoid protein [Candidatus Methanomethyliaceae archaeon]MDW7970468.1 corrinoid protein [Nitrososphaerota archaeon]